MATRDARSGETGAGPTRRPVPRAGRLGWRGGAGRSRCARSALRRRTHGQADHHSLEDQRTGQREAEQRPSAGGEPSPRRRRIGRRLRLGFRTLDGLQGVAHCPLRGLVHLGQQGADLGILRQLPPGCRAATHRRLAGIRRARRWVKDPHLSTCPGRVASSRAASWAIGRRLERAPDAKEGRDEPAPPSAASVLLACTRPGAVSS